MKPLLRKPVTYIALLAAIGLCAYQTKVSGPVNDPVYQDLDPTVSPGADFFMYANGGWIKRNPIPAAYSSWGIGNLVQEEIRDRLKKINDEALTANAPAARPHKR